MALNLFLEIKQNSHDVLLLNAIKVYLGVGTIKPNYDIFNIVAAKESRPVSVLVVRQTATIIEFVNRHPMLTTKSLNYED